MGNTYTKLVYHIVFSTKGRAPLIIGALRETLYEYVGGIVRKEGGSLLQIGGMPDHVHVLARCKPDVALSQTVQSIKGKSSRWLNQLPDRGYGFGWQSGYGAFSVSESQVAAVRRYIETQEEHHAHQTFRDELIALLQKHRIDFEERYLD